MTTPTATDPSLPLPEARRVEEVPRRLLLRLPNWLGDVVMAAPTVAAIRRACPDTELVGQARPELLGLAGLLPGIRETIPAGRDRSPRELLASRRRLRAADLDAAVTFPRGARALLAPRLAGIQARIGYAAPGHGLLLTHAVGGWRPWRRAHRSAFFGLLALPFDTRPTIPWRCEPPPEALAAADRLLRGIGRRRDRPLVVLEPGAAYGPAKCWPATRYGELAARLLARDIDVATIGTKASVEVEDVVAARAGESLLRVAGLTPDLTVLAALLARADLLVTGDTGPMHLAAAVGCPVLALFGASDPVVSAPAGHGARRLLYEPEPCSPCFERHCPVAGHPCLDRFGASRVEAEALTMLEAGGG